MNTIENQPFHERLAQRDLLIGTMITLPAPEITDLLKNVGYDWFWVDGEHGQLSNLDIQHLLIGANPTPCLVRVSLNSEEQIKHPLDAGAAGVIVPMVNTEDEAARAVKFAKYPPMGIRGTGIARAQDYGLNFASYVQTANASTSVVVQAEHIKAVENIHHIVQVEGVRAIMVGPYDLSASMGHIGQVQHNEVIQAIDHITQTCTEAGMPLGIFGLTPDAVKPYIQKGYSLINVGVDITMLGAIARQMLMQTIK